MARLPWNHTRTRTKSSGEKTQIGNTPEWFSRHTSEPSRQALADLVKAHKREKSDESSGSRSRSRGNTVTSSEWQRTRSRADSASEETWSRPASPHHFREGSIYSTLDRTESSAKALLAKGGLILRRNGSKMSLSSAGSSSTHGFTSPPRHHVPNSSVSHPSSRGEEIRAKISAPFDFQHVTHTEQNQFVGLGRIEETELANQFSTAMKDQTVASGLRGIEASDIQPTELEHHAITTDIPSAGLHMSLSQSPATPQGPTPPPKDEVSTDYIAASTALPDRANSSIQASPMSPYFPRQPTAPTIARKPLLQRQCVPLSSVSKHIVTTEDEAAHDNKPLPQLPVIHAVTTEDDSARALIAAPLPTPPGVPTVPGSDYMSKRPIHRRQQSSFALPRHMSFYPATKTSMPDLLNTNRLSVAPRTLPRHRSDMALSQQAKFAPEPTDSRSRSSMSFAAVDTMNWEDAVDQAWDVEDDYCDSALEGSQSTSFDSQYTSSSILLDSFTSDDGRSTISTPLTMTPTRALPAVPSERSSPIAGNDVRKLESVQEDEYNPRLSGLGISSCPSSGTAPSAAHFSRSSSARRPKRRSSLYDRSESLTRSSSQESIILSIASSIIGTQRSSNSSVNTDELFSMSRIDEKPTIETVEDELTPQRNARPESGCLPPGVFVNVAKAGHSPVRPVIEQEAAIPPVPPVPQHKYSESASKIIVPERKSSVRNSDSNRTTRARSNTTGARPRQSARISYSLFPIATPTPAP